MAAIRPGNADRAWNDPPVFAFESGGPGQPPPVKRSVLSGRIRHPQPAPSPGPLGSHLPESTPSPEAPSVDELSHPPAPSFPPGRTTDVPPSSSLVQKPPAAVTTQSLTGDCNAGSVQDSATLRTETLQFLEQVLQTFKDQVDDRVVADVRRRLTLLSSSWSDGKLSQPVHIKMHQLAQALSREDVDTANSLHLSLMVDYVSEVSQWMVGIKRLIHEVRERCCKKSEGEPPVV